MGSKVYKALVIATAAITLSACGGNTASPSASPTTPSNSTSVSQTPSPTASPVTELTLKFADCQGCRVALQRFVYTEDGKGKRNYLDEYRSPSKIVNDGSVTFTIETNRTPGLVVVLMRVMPNQSW